MSQKRGLRAFLQMKVAELEKSTNANTDNINIWCITQIIDVASCNSPNQGCGLSANLGKLAWFSLHFTNCEEWITNSLCANSQGWADLQDFCWTCQTQTWASNLPDKPVSNSEEITECVPQGCDWSSYNAPCMRIRNMKNKIFLLLQSPLDLNLKSVNNLGAVFQINI